MCLEITIQKADWNRIEDFSGEGDNDLISDYGFHLHNRCPITMYLDIKEKKIKVAIYFMLYKAYFREFTLKPILDFLLWI